MSKKRVHEIAKEFGVESKQVISILQQNNINVTKAVNSVDDSGYEIVKKQYSVRELELMAKKSRRKDISTKNDKTETVFEGNADEMEYLKSKLIEFFESKVEIKLLNENQGKLEIEFYGYEDLERILNILKLDLE